MSALLTDFRWKLFMNNNSYKKVVLLLVGVSDVFCDPDSPRFIATSQRTVGAVDKLADKMSKISALVNVTPPSDTFKKVKFQHPVKSKNVKFDLFTKTFLNQFNVFALNSSVDNETVLMKADQFDFVFDPEEYEVHIAGIDIYGIFTSIIDDLRDRGFDIVVYSDVIRPYNKQVVEHLREHCTYTSAHSALRDKQSVVELKG